MCPRDIPIINIQELNVRSLPLIISNLLVLIKPISATSLLAGLIVASLNEIYLKIL